MPINSEMSHEICKDNPQGTTANFLGKVRIRYLPDLCMMNAKCIMWVAPIPGYGSQHSFFGKPYARVDETTLIRLRTDGLVPTTLPADLNSA